MSRILLCSLATLLWSMTASGQCPPAQVSVSQALEQLSGQKSVKRALKPLKRTRPAVVQCNAKLGTLELRQWFVTPKRWSKFGVAYEVELAAPVHGRTGGVLASAIWEQRLLRLVNLKRSVQASEKSKGLSGLVRRYKNPRGTYHFGGQRGDCFSIAPGARDAAKGSQPKRSVRICAKQGLTAYTVHDWKRVRNQEVLELRTWLVSQGQNVRLKWLTMRRNRQSGWDVVGAYTQDQQGDVTYFSGSRGIEGPWGLKKK